MALPKRIELRAGAGPRIQYGLWLLWLVALINLLFYLQRLPIPLILVSMFLLWWSLPGNAYAVRHPRCLILHDSGRAEWDGVPGFWLRNTWRTRWYTAITFKAAKRTHVLWISARQNPVNAYRHLGVWCHFPPHSTGPGVNDSHLRINP